MYPDEDSYVASLVGMADRKSFDLKPLDILFSGPARQLLASFHCHKGLSLPLPQLPALIARSWQDPGWTSKGCHALIPDYQLL